MEKSLKQSDLSLLKGLIRADKCLTSFAPQMRLIEPYGDSSMLKKISARTKKLSADEPLEIFDPHDPCWSDGIMASADDIRDVSNYFEFLKALDPAAGTGIPSYISIRYIDSSVGYGVFAARTIKKGEFIGCYAGEWKLDEDSESDYIFEPLDDSNIFIDGENCGNFTRYVNHAFSIKCNLEAIIYLKKHPRLHLPLVIYYAKKKIEKGQQLLINYGRQYWNEAGYKPI